MRAPCSRPRSHGHLHGGTHQRQGRRIYPSTAAACVLGGKKSPLTERELAILHRICHNMSYEEIAAELGITKRTVNFHVGNMLAKTGYKSIVGLAVEAAERGYAGSAP